jgi:hypothetical protein
VIDLCSESKTTLAALSLLSPFYQPYAEAYLYQDVAVQTYEHCLEADGFEALTAVAESARRASYVKSFNLKLEDTYPDMLVVPKVVKVLGHMTSLEHLYLQFTRGRHYHVKFAMNVSKAIGSVVRQPGSLIC